jgi:hypothetical protein
VRLPIVVQEGVGTALEGIGAKFVEQRTAKARGVLDTDVEALVVPLDEGNLPIGDRIANSSPSSLQ